MNSTTQLPIPALIGLETAQQALLLLAVEPKLRGVILAAPVGTGKSSLARGMSTLLGDDDIPFIEMPTSVDIENLLGGLDLESTLRTGQMVLQPGLLARANEGLVYIDGINLLTDGSANLILAVLDQGEVQVEREGVSLRSPARFSLIGSYDPAEGLPRRHLLDRVGLLAPLPNAVDAGQRRSVIRHNLLATSESWGEEMDFMRGLVQAARAHLPQVTISDSQLQSLSVTALQYGVEGHRVDLFATQAACASAALALRDAVDDEDLELAARLVILPRATQISPPPAEDNSPPPPSQSPEPEPQQAEPEQSDEDGASTPQQIGLPPEQILEALASELPDSLEELPFYHVRRGKTGSRGATEGRRGRHIRSVPGDPRRSRIDVAATLRTATPWQRLRRSSQPDGNGQQHRTQIQMTDVRVKQYRSKAGALFCFGVDASGSMALHRMRQAKGAVHALLQKAYVHRDRVALLAFRGQEAELLMPPTQSVELARRALDLLPTGGGTPLASALLLAMDVAKQAEGRGIHQTVLLLLTDGRANISLRPEGNIQEELQQIGRAIAETNLHVVVVDTKRNYLSKGEARQLAEWLNGDYAYLPNANGEQIAELATSVAEG